MSNKETSNNEETSFTEIARTSDENILTDIQSKSKDKNGNTSTTNEKDEETTIKDFEKLYEVLKERKTEGYLHFKVKRQTQKLLTCCSYYHHFVLLEVIELKKDEQNKENTNGGIDPTHKEQEEETNKDKNKDTIKVMVAHYTSSKEIFTNNSKFGIGKFISETIIVKNQKNVRNELFDFKSEISLVNHTSISTVDYTIRERLYKRLGERMYDFGTNNCEDAVNYILTGKSESKESKSRPRCADLVSAAFGELKEFGLKVAMMIALISSLAGSLTRYSYVRLLIAAVAAERSDIGVNETCSNLLGDNIILEAKVVLDKHSEIPRFSEITSSEDIISDIKASLNNPFLCEIAELLAMEAITKTFWLSVCMSVSVETMFLIKRIIFVYIPLFEIQIKKDFFRMILVRLVAGYLSIPIGILGGSVGQAYLSPPALYFFVFAFFASLIARYILTIVASCMYECLYCCFCECCACCCLDTDKNKTKKDVEIGCPSSDEERSNPKYTFKHYLCFGAAALSYSFCIAGIIVALYYFLD